jgi:hypothetical protein
MWMFHSAAAPSARTRPGKACAKAPSTRSGTIWPITWRTDTGAGRSAFRILTGEDTVNGSSEAQLFGMSGATTHFSA